MAQRGTPLRPIRIPQVLLDEIQEQISTSDPRKTGLPRTLTAWILKAIREKLDHMRRSRGGKAPRSSSSTRPTTADCPPELVKHLEENDRLIEAMLAEGFPEDPQQSDLFPEDPHQLGSVQAAEDQADNGISLER